MNKTLTIVIIILSCITPGCLPDTSGNDPPDDTLIFPIGLVTSLEDKFLFVANSNFDLEFNAGTLVSLNLDLFYEDLQKIRIAENTDICLVENDNCHLYEDRYINAAGTIFLGAFASDLELTPSKDRIIIPVRGERAISLIDVGANGSLSCGQGEDRRCDSVHKVESNDLWSLPIEPFEVASLDYVEPPAPEDPSAQRITTLGFATHLDGGEVSLFVINDGSHGGRASAELISVVKGVIPGASGIAVNPVTRDILVSGRRAPVPFVAVMRVMTDAQNGSFSHNPFFSSVKKIELQEDMLGATDSRGLAVASSGDLAFMVVRTPQSLVKLDVQNYELVDIASVGAEPSTVALLEDDRGTVDTNDDAVFAFVLCFPTDQVYIIDTNLMEVVAVRSTGAGPQAIAFDKTRKLVYIANFRESTITLLNAEWPFDYVRDSKNREVKIGKPRLPKGHD